MTRNRLRHVNFLEDCPALERTPGCVVRPVLAEGVLIAHVRTQPHTAQGHVVAPVETILVGRSGTFEVTTEDGVTPLSADEVVIVPQGTRYSVTSGATLAERIDIFAPPDAQLLEEALHHEHDQHGFE